MKKIFSVLLVCNIMLVSSLASAALSPKMRTFLLSAGYGAVIGAGVGVVSLLAEDKPDKHMINIARGASLGLYAGMAYGLYVNYGMTQSQPQSDYTLVPRFDQKGISGADLNVVAYRF